MPRRQRIEVARTIDRPLDVVFNALSDERESPQWRSATAADYDVGGPCVIGAKFWRAAGGRRREAFEVTSCEPYRVYATAAVEGGAVEAINCRRIDALTTEVEWVLERPASSGRCSDRVASPSGDAQRTRRCGGLAGGGGALGSNDHFA